MWLFVLIVGLPLAEISLFVTLGAWLGLWLTLGVVIGTTILGIWLIRRQGERAQTDLRAAMMARQNPAPALASDALNVVAGLLLILPGFLTDTLGALLLLPPVQRWVVARLALRAHAVVQSQVRTQAWGAATSATMSTRRDQDVIDGTWEELPPDENTPRSGWTRH